MEILLGAICLALFYLWLQTRSLKKRITFLENGMQPAENTVAETPPSEVTPKDANTDGPWSPPEPVDRPVLKKKLIGQAAAATSAISQDAQAAENPRSFVFRTELLSSTIKWLAANWFYVLAAASLALAGIFLIQYSVAAGLLPPHVRVIGGLIFGGALIFVAEYLRRKGSDEAGELAYLPSTFASAGFVTLFASFWGAYTLYGLIGPQLAFSLLAGVGIAAIICGWVYGPLVSVVGTIGAISTPFLLGGESENAHFLMPYFAAVAAGSLTIDSLKRWAWLSVLALVLATGAASLIYFATDAKVTYLLTLLALAVLATIIPGRSLIPAAEGPALIPALAHNLTGPTPRTWPDFPPRLTFAMVLVASAAILSVFTPNPDVFWLCLTAISVLLVLTLLWMMNARGLEDTTLPPSLALLGLAVLCSPRLQGDFWSFTANAPDPSTSAITQPLLALGAVALLTSVVAFVRSTRATQHPTAWAAFAVTFAPVMAIVLEYFWTPADILGRPLWALLLIVVAASLTWFTLTYAKRDGENRLRVSLAASSSIVMISFALTALLSDAALTVALALATALTAYIAKSQNLPLMRHLIALGAIVVSSRLVFYPGVLWAVDTSLLNMVFAYAASITLLEGGRRLLNQAGSAADLVLHSASWSLSGIFGTLLLFRLADHLNMNSDLLIAGLIASVWLILAFAQLYRLQSDGWIKKVRIGLASIYLSIVALMLVVSITAHNPLHQGRVGGVPIFNPILVAYGLPTALLTAMALKLRHLSNWVRIVFGGSAVVFAIFTVGLLIRHFWRRPDLRLPGIEPAELYSYTVVMMIGSGLLLIAALAKKHQILRKAALIGLGLTAAKVFLIDASGLTGLLRVFAFLCLGLTLAGLAWLNRRFGDEPTLTNPDVPDTETRGDNDDTKDAG